MPIKIEDFRRALNPHWQPPSVVNSVQRGQQTFLSMSDGTLVVEAEGTRSARLPEGHTIHETANGLQINHSNGIVIEIVDDEVYIGDGLTTKHWGTFRCPNNDLSESR